MKILLTSLHARRSPQAVPLAAANLLAALPEPRRSSAELLNFYPEQPQEEILAEILRHSPDLVASSTYLWTRESVLALSADLKEQQNPLHLSRG